MQETITYIIEFLLHGNKHLISEVGYTNDVNQFHRYRVVIIPSHFFDDSVYGTVQSMPQLPLGNIEHTPLLFGKPLLRKEGNTLLIEADIIASSYFLLSRYEEMLNPKTLRDEHGRFIGKKSLPYQAGFIDRPIVDEYGQLLRGWLREQGCDVTEPEAKYNNIFLTHDVDSIAHFRHLRGTIGGFIRGILHKGCAIKIVLKSLLSLENDPAYTFPWIYRRDKHVQSAIPIYFIKATKHVKGLDYPGYKLNGKDFTRFVKHTLNNCPNAQFGLHASYQSGYHPDLIAKEQNRLQKVFPKQTITRARHHYLHALQPEDMMYLIKAGITDDYTMGYADIAGFRLGTCRAVQFVNPHTKELTSLTIHPLTMMDCTLSNNNYMNLSYDEAFSYACQLIDTTKKYHGDVCLLWHNTIVDNQGINKNSYHKRLYSNIINYLQNSIE